MATVGVTIAGRTYRMACAEGEEAHLHDLARHVDSTLTSLRKSFGEIGDQRLVIMTAITVADELSEARQRIGQLEEEVTRLTADQSADEASHTALAEDLAGSLDAAAERIERLTQRLTGTPGE